MKKKAEEIEIIEILLDWLHLILKKWNESSWQVLLSLAWVRPKKLGGKHSTCIVFITCGFETTRYNPDGVGKVIWN